jgi:UDP-N-acetylglucosamine--dolichyl-phosphate N-acetylglucosaminephosphotransferase
MEEILFISIFFSFILCLLILPKWIKKCKTVGLLWEDMNKYKHPKNVAASGGIVVVMAFVIGVLAYIAIRTFVIQDTDGITRDILGLLSMVLILAVIGLTDDMLGWKHGGLSWRFRIILAFVASIPLVVINAGESAINFPFIGLVELGLLYPLVLIPLGVAGATTTYNFLAGFNGLEAGQGIIIVSFLSYIAYLTGNPWLAMVGLCLVASLLVFYYYNRFPAKVFPGDILTWTIGSIIAGIAILGNFEKIAVFVFMLYIAEFFLKVRGGFSPAKQSFGIPNKDGSLEMPYEGRIYGLTHLSIWILKKFKDKVYEKDVVYFILAIQIIICLAALVVFKSSLFV